MLGERRGNTIICQSCTDTSSFFRLVVSEKGELVSKWRFYLFNPIKTENDMGFSSMPAAAAHWLDGFWRHQAVVREKETGFFLVLLHRVAHAEIKLQHHSHIRPVRHLYLYIFMIFTNSTWPYLTEKPVFSYLIFINTFRSAWLGNFNWQTFAHRRLSKPWQSETADD